MLFWTAAASVLDPSICIKPEQVQNLEQAREKFRYWLSNVVGLPEYYGRFCSHQIDRISVLLYVLESEGFESSRFWFLPAVHFGLFRKCAMALQAENEKRNA